MACIEADDIDPYARRDTERVDRPGPGYPTTSRLCKALMRVPALLLFCCGAVAAAECTQEKAIYADSGDTYELAFEPVDPESSSSSHVFKLTVRETAVVLDGYVMGSEPVNRSNGIIFHNCPDGDVTGDDIAACTVWEGTIYASAQGKFALLPLQGTQASAEILLAGFGPSLAASNAWGPGKAHVVPWDAFALKGCKS